MQPSGRHHQWRHTIVVAKLCVLVGALAAGCDGGAAVSSNAGATRGSNNTANNSSTQTDSGQTSTTAAQGAASGNTGKVASITVAFLSPVSSSGVVNLWSKDSAETQCATLVATAKDSSDAVVGDAVLDFTMTSNSAGATDLGTLASASVTTNNSTGLANNVYCPPTFTSANQRKEVTIKVMAGKTLSGTSELIVVQRQPVYELSFVRLTTQDASAFTFPSTRVSSANTATLDLLGAGDYDCAYARFQLLRNGNAYGNLPGIFSVSRNPPSNVRLALRGSDGSFPATQSPYSDYLTYSVTPTSAGIYNLPVCAGTATGSFSITGYVSYTDALSGASKVVTVTSPLAVTVGAGLVNYTDMSLAFDTTNARTLIGSFTNDASSAILNFTLNLGSRVDGAPTSENPVQVYAETGRVTVGNGGVPSATGTVPFSLQILHMATDRPYLVNDYVSAASTAIASYNTANGTSIQRVQTSANTTCNIQQLAKSAAWTDTTPPGTSKVIWFRDLARNWATTLVYAIRGQEAFNDVLGSGVYDYAATNQGFVDRNQNGHFDDAYTDDATKVNYLDEEIWVNGSKQSVGTQFNASGKWFIDMQRSYIDVDDDRKYTKGIDEAKDCAAGNLDANGKCNDVNPNGKRDAATTIWKSLRVPIYMGSSVAALTHNAIESAWYDLTSDNSNLTMQTRSLLSPAVQYFYDQYRAEGSSQTSGFTAPGNVVTYGTGAPYLLTDSAKLATAYASSLLPQQTGVFFFAQSICGTPLPGGATIDVTVIPPSGNTRTPVPKIYKQPGDTLIESKRHFLVAGSGASANGSAVVNSDVIDHPAAYHSFPVLFYLELPECTTRAQGSCPAGQTQLVCPLAVHGINVKVRTLLDEVNVNGTVVVPAASGACS